MEDLNLYDHCDVIKYNLLMYDKSNNNQLRFYCDSLREKNNIKG